MPEHPGYDYTEVQVEKSISETALSWGDHGWETVSVIPPVGLGRIGYSLLLKRVKRNPYNQVGGPEEYRQWEAWEKRFGTKFDRFEEIVVYSDSENPYARLRQGTRVVFPHSNEHNPFDPAGTKEEWIQWLQWEQRHHGG